MSYKISVDNIDDVYCCYKSPILTLQASTEYTAFYLPYRGTSIFYPEQVTAYFYYKNASTDTIQVSLGWLTTNPSATYTDWTQTNTIGSGNFQGYFRELAMNGETYQTGLMFRKAAPGGTRIVAKTGAKSGTTMQVIFAIDGYWTGEILNELP